MKIAQARGPIECEALPSRPARERGVLPGGEGTAKSNGNLIMSASPPGKAMPGHRCEL
jgi:hypothetical protein